MDIAKIRKKAQLRKKKKRDKAEGKAADQPADTVRKDILEDAAEEKIQKSTHVSEEVIREQELPAPEETSEEDTAERIEEENPEVDELETGEQLELLTFNVGKEEFAFRVPEFEEIINYQSITNVPTVPDYVIGITSLRGKIIPVIDLKERLGLQKLTPDSYDEEADVSSESQHKAKILIVNGPKGLIGASIDRVVGVVKVSLNKILEPPANLTEAELKFIEGVVIFEKRFISIIRAEETLDIEIG